MTIENEPENTQYRHITYMRFKYVKLFGGYSQQIGRRLLAGIFSAKKPSKKESETAPTVGYVQQATRTLKKIRSCWLRRVEAFAAIGGFKSQLSRQFATNCPPSGALLSPHSKQLHKCGYAMFCPFCYARRFIDETWPTLNALLIDPKTKTSRSHIIRLGKTLRWEARWPVGSPESVNEISLSLITAKRAVDAMLSLLGEAAAGAVSAIRVYPHGTNGWTISIGVLALTPLAGFCDNEVFAKFGIAAAYFPEVKRRHLGSVIYPLFKYPRMLLFGDVRILKDILEARKGHRLVNYHGKCGTLYIKEAKNEWAQAAEARRQAKKEKEAASQPNSSSNSATGS